MKTPLRNSRFVMAIACCAALPLTALAQDGPWLVRVRAVNLNSVDKDSTGLNLSVNNKTIPEVDFSYFFSPTFAAELVLTYPQKQSVRSNGVDIASFKHLPPTLTGQYHFQGMGAFQPYVGAGLNYTRLSSVRFVPALAALQSSLSKNSFGLALQVGADFQIARNTYLNLDVKKVQIRTDVKSFGTKIGELKLDPWLVGVGVGMRF